MLHSDWLHLFVASLSQIDSTKILKCIWNENFDIGFFAFSENVVFSDHKNTNLVEKFEPEVC
jgi:hypothetical protein